MAEEKQETKEMTGREKRLSHLRPFRKGDGRAAAGARKGAETKRRKKVERKNIERAAEVLNKLMRLTLRDGKPADLDNATNLQAFSKENLTIQQAMLMALLKRAVEKGDKACAELILKVQGELVDKTEISGEITVDGEQYKGLTEEQLIALANLSVDKK